MAPLGRRRGAASAASVKVPLPVANDRLARALQGTQPGRSTATLTPVLLVCLCLAGAAPPAGAAAEAPIRLAQSAGDLLDMGKEALGLGETTPEGTARTGITSGVPFLVRFRGTVGSLAPGAPVLVRGMRMGTVREVRVTFDPATASFAVPVVIELDPAPFVAGEPGEAAAARVRAAVGAMVRAGLRAELAAANLFPGALAVALEMRPEAGPAELRPAAEGGPPEIPTTGAPFEPLTAKLERQATRVAALPLERTLAELEGLLAAARRRVEDPALPRLLANLAEGSEALAPAARRLDPTLRATTDLAAQARATLAETRALLERSTTLPHELERALEELTATARSLRQLAELLERRPEAVLRGKGG
jgi:paraquat-inducible protein B